MRTLKHTLAIMTCLAALSGFAVPSGAAYSKENTALTAIAAETNKVWDGTIDTSWYDDDDVEFHITTPQELAGLSKLIESGKSTEGKTFYLDNDMYMNDISDYENWTETPPQNNCSGLSIIGSEGIFDGNNHTIYGWYSGGTVFGTNKGTIQNLTLKNGKNGSSTLCYTNTEDGQIINCHNYNEIIWWSRIGSNASVGGLCIENNGTILNCSNHGNINIDPSKDDTSATFFIGGISAKCEKGVFLNCENYGSISLNHGNLSSCVGGICGRAFYSEYKDCNNYGKIVSSSGSYCGGIAGESQGGNISYCTNSGDINSLSCSGGIFGFTNDKIMCCKNTGDINGKEFSGGIAGYGSPNIFHSCNYGNITSSEFAGGIVGNFNGKILKNLYNCGEVTGKKAAGICYSDSSSDFCVYNAYNTGAITGDIVRGINIEKNINCYYLNTSATSGGGNASSKSAANMKKEVFAENLGSAFIYVENDYPVLFWEKGLDLVEIDKSELSFTEYGQQESLTAETTAEDGIVWSSDDEKIATVDKNGVVTAVGNGTTIIRAASGEAKATCKITVNYDYYIEESGLILDIDKAKPLTVYSRNTEKPVEDIEIIFKSSNEKVASVDEKGFVSANFPGTAEIHIIIGDIDIVCNISVNTVMGDVNGDGEFSVSDLVAMQKYILGSGSLAYWQGGDYNHDDTIDVFDLVRMRKAILRK